jgi:hypothetical protein
MGNLPEKSAENASYLPNAGAKLGKIFGIKRFIQNG